MVLHQMMMWLFWEIDKVCRFKHFAPFLVFRAFCAFLSPCFNFLYKDSFDGAKLLIFLGHRLAPYSFLVGLVLQTFTLANWWVLGVVDEGAAGGVETLLLHHLAAHVARRGELQALAGGYGADLVAASVGVVVLPFRDINHGEGAEGLDGNTE